MRCVSVGTSCRTSPQQLTEVIQPTSAAWLTELVPVSGGRWTEHYVVHTDGQYGDLVALIVSVRHRHVTEQWYLQQVIVVSDPDTPQRTVHHFPCHDVVPARVTLRTGHGNNKQQQQGPKLRYDTIEEFNVDSKAEYTA